MHDNDGFPRILIVAETPKRRPWAYDIVDGDRVKNKRVWEKLPGQFRGPDGIDLDEHYNLLVTYQRSSSIVVFRSDGGWPVKTIRCSFTRPSNLHFRPESSEVFVTEHQFDGLWMFEWECKGKPQMCDIKSFR